MLDILVQQFRLLNEKVRIILESIKRISQVPQFKLTQNDAILLLNILLEGDEEKIINLRDNIIGAFLYYVTTKKFPQTIKNVNAINAAKIVLRSALLNSNITHKFLLEYLNYCINNFNKIDELPVFLEIIKKWEFFIGVITRFINSRQFTNFDIKKYLEEHIKQVEHRYIIKQYLFPLCLLERQDFYNYVLSELMTIGWIYLCDFSYYGVNFQNVSKKTLFFIAKKIVEFAASRNIYVAALPLSAPLVLLLGDYIRIISSRNDARNLFIESISGALPEGLLSHLLGDLDIIREHR